MRDDSRTRFSLRRSVGSPTILVAVASFLGALLVSAPANAVNNCYDPYEFGYVSGGDYLNEFHGMWDTFPPYSYTDISVWDRHVGDGHGYSAERRDSSAITYFANVEYGVRHYFDNGGYSPYRKTWLFGWYLQDLSSWIWQQNDNGPC
jgi:hypothetical protein